MRRIGGVQLTSRGDRLIPFGLLVTCLLVLAQAIAQLVNYRFFDLRLRAIDSQGDGGVFGVIGDLALAFAAAAAWAASGRIPTARRQLKLLAPLLTFLAVDKAV